MYVERNRSLVLCFKNSYTCSQVLSALARVLKNVIYKRKYHLHIAPIEVVDFFHIIWNDLKLQIHQGPALTVGAMFLSLHTIDILDQVILFCNSGNIVGTALCNEGCLAVSLVFLPIRCQ